ncbi:poly [ADP-ribose] polymerase tankyrase-like [Schistocerca cancellata]|uniref:poly [ADP-ribose] polymerase tankyrase-like n=1 Tax=Schistocerca cancellata TaxID=274614 RepID=UPI0021182C0F|nr:poly [ADP-ribose] polymerase tankyrase-like [Schistocerca cancellata]XP_049769762.1 poly [ADP-ribose] polymerase tankyrase-like [Schistocerca cancellata]XP_049769763.1 poly [ADP-ribose] polymerase tankyrase-like [Schistocerca cancellata]XP_049769764.1 poly [ADP-ribose] polymerase tankyrase-like [Schistocerca cancellata]
MATTDTKDGSFASDMGALLESGEGADVTLVVGTSQLPVHSFVLAARSPVFAATFRNDMKEGRSRRIEITDVREAVLRQLLRFVYTDETPQLASMAAELLAASDKYDLPLLKKRCEQQLAQGLTVDNAAATAVLAVLHSCSRLESAAVNFIASHPEVMISAGWINMLRSNAEAAVQICTLAAAAAPNIRTSPVKQTSPVNQTQNMAARLTEAAKCGRVDELQNLLAEGAPVDARDTSGFTALHLAVMKAGESKFIVSDVGLHTVKCLLNAGANVNAEDLNKQTPLHLAAYRGDLKILWVLLTSPVQLNARDRWGKTPLHWAAATTNKEATRMLLLSGADKEASDSECLTPEDVASSFTKKLFSVY